jgi:hypothetical protein
MDFDKLLDWAADNKIKFFILFFVGIFFFIFIFHLSSDLNSMENKIENINTNLLNINQKIDDVSKRTLNLEKKVEILESKEADFILNISEALFFDEVEKNKIDIEKLSSELKQIKDNISIINFDTVKTKSNDISYMGDKEVYQIGEDILVDDLKYKILTYYLTSHVGSEYFGETTTGKFLVVKFSIENIGMKSNKVYSPRMFIIDDKNREFDESSSSRYVDDNIGFGEQLQPGLKKTFQNVFEIPKGLNSLKLKITGDWQSKSEITINLKG